MESVLVGLPYISVDKPHRKVDIRRRVGQKKDKRERNLICVMVYSSSHVST
jgi:hypothetical protein